MPNTLPAPDENPPRCWPMITAKQSNDAFDLLPIRNVLIPDDSLNVVMTVRCAIHAMRAETREDEKRWLGLVKFWAGRGLRHNPPYPEFCPQPDVCAGKSYCQRDYCCAD